MKTATLASVHVEPGFRAEVEAVLAEGETLPEFVEASVRAGYGCRTSSCRCSRRRSSSSVG